MSIANGDLLKLLARAWYLVNHAGGPASAGDWEKESPSWAQQADAWRQDYLGLRHQLEGEQGALEARMRAALDGLAVSDEVVADLLALAEDYAESFPANYVMRNPPVPDEGTTIPPS